MRCTGLREMVRLLCVVLFSLLVCEPLAAQSGRTTDIAVVANPAVSVNDLSLAEVRKVFLGERQYWKAKLPVVLLIRAPVARERDVVLRVIYQMTEVQFKRYWIAKIFQAEAASAPKVVYSNSIANDILTAIPGAIAFVDARDVRPGLKVLRVNGRLPGEADYPLR